MANFAYGDGDLKTNAYGDHNAPTNLVRMLSTTYILLIMLKLDQSVPISIEIECNMNKLNR